MKKSLFICIFTLFTFIATAQPTQAVTSVDYVVKEVKTEIADDGLYVSFTVKAKGVGNVPGAFNILNFKDVDNQLLIATPGSLECSHILNKFSCQKETVVANTDVWHSVYFRFTDNSSIDALIGKTLVFKLKAPAGVVDPKMENNKVSVVISK